MTEPLSNRQRQEYVNRHTGSLAYVSSERTAPKLDATVICAAYANIYFIFTWHYPSPRVGRCCPFISFLLFGLGETKSHSNTAVNGPILLASDDERMEH
jgi:hypothetical protein